MRHLALAAQTVQPIHKHIFSWQRRQSHIPIQHIDPGDGTDHEWNERSEPMSTNDLNNQMAKRMHEDRSLSHAELRSSLKFSRVTYYHDSFAPSPRKGTEAQRLWPQP